MSMMTTTLTTNILLTSRIHVFYLIVIITTISMITHYNRHSVASHNKVLHCKEEDKLCLVVRNLIPRQVRRCTSKHLDAPPASTSCSAARPILFRMLLQSVSSVLFSERVVTRRRLLRAPSLCCSRDPLEKQEAFANVVAHNSRSCAVLAANSYIILWLESSS